MEEYKKNAIKELTIFLKQFGFVKKGSVWALRKKEFLLSIDLQKSQWSEIHYVNVGIQFDNLDERLPKAYKGGIGYRVIQFGKDGSKDGFTLEFDVPLLQKLILEQVVKPFVHLETKQEVRGVIVANLWRYIVSVDTRTKLGIPQE